jgi:hypothetical protein
MHFDGMMYAPTLLLDGRPIVENGAVVEPAWCRRDVNA